MKKAQSDWLHDFQEATGKSGLYPALELVLEESRRYIADSRKNGADKQTSKSLKKLVVEVSARLGLELALHEIELILHYIRADEEGFGVLQPLIDDREVSDILVSGPHSVLVQKNRRNQRTAINFPSQQYYEHFVERLLLQAGVSYSTRNPIVDGMIGQNIRIHAAHRSVSSDGPYLTLRVNQYSSISAQRLVELGFGCPEIFTYLKHCMGAGLSLLIVGEVGTGKTTLARAIAGSIPANESVLVIEDTPEIQLDLPYVRYLQTRPENCEGEGRITPSQLIRAGMRMAMNRIIFGEIRDAEAAEAFVDCCSSGHPGLSTIHGKSVSDSITRMMLFLGRAQPNVSADILRQQVSTAVQVVVHVGMCEAAGKRRIREIRELGEVVDGVMRQRVVFRYQSSNEGVGWQVESPASMFTTASVNKHLGTIDRFLSVSGDAS